TCSVAADQPGDARYASAPRATASAQVAKAAQAIAFAPLANKVATDAAFTASVTGGNSGNAVVLSTTSTACSVSGKTVTLLRAGTCAVSADQAGNADYDAAPQVTQSFAVALAPQTIA